MQTLFIGQQRISVECVDSTNNYAATLLNETNLPEGAVIMAHEQTAGRGQRGNSWSVEPGMNLTISLVLYPRFLEISRQFLLSKITALALVKTIAILGKQAKIKWPNDIFIGKQKIAGILIENSTSGNQLSQSIVGVGLNVNQTVFSGLLNATSLKLETGQHFELNEVLEVFCRQFEYYYLKLRQGQQDEIAERYLSELLNFNKKAQFLSEGVAFSGTISGLTSNGKLEVTKEDGTICRFDLKELIQLI